MSAAEDAFARRLADLADWVARHAATAVMGVEAGGRFSDFSGRARIDEPHAQTAFSNGTCTTRSLNRSAEGEWPVAPRRRFPRLSHPSS